MQSLDILKKRIKTTSDLLSVVKTMKSLAAVNIRHFEQAALSLTEYADVVEKAWIVLFQSEGIILPQSRDSHTVILAIGTDQGMCGQFNELSIQAALRLGNEAQSAGFEVAFWTVGDRMNAGLKSEGYTAQHHFQVPGTLGGLDHLIGDIMRHMAEWYKHARGQFYVVHNAQNKLEGYGSMHRRVLPLDRQWEEEITAIPWPNRCLPQTNLPTDILFANLFEQHMFVSLYGSLARSMAAENAARLAAMQAAEKNIEEMQIGLRGEFLQTRQTAITDELLDIIGGAEAMTSPF
ncbi:F0F1 ATP synthase subunit gamma [Pseudodesulfovibrio sp. zrk46]|uniref:F0F1 ATP synthase subunit gamma n=1 Tax=Pseudodesulfovibrio sp. zrk46 TaxID=2725288 RepID=UPI0014493045|nr:F0F1 ATP synthase subunit gamma [Pseudodesulfovibrio sp. zrk46]QJB57559.1 ATPase [Pseudodesulfovibrio sp. zrk46]